MLCIYLYYYSIVQLIIIYITLVPNCLVICETCSLLNVMRCLISYHLHNSKKRGKHPLTLLFGWFSRFLNCTNDTQIAKRITYVKDLDKKIIEFCKIKFTLLLLFY